jgi:hypothetical protein
MKITEEIRAMATQDPVELPGAAAAAESLLDNPGKRIATL